ncbi:MAG TPA: hypothetical protein VFL94_11040 [Actinomycetales bacterium]|nr:hypothetical protein [Actinomycetales bacterium]
MGRHGRAPQRRTLPWELVGWCAFAGVVAAVALLLMGEPWLTAVLVLCAGAVAVVVLVVLALAGSGSGASPGQRRDHP